MDTVTPRYQPLSGRDLVAVAVVCVLSLMLTGTIWYWARSFEHEVAQERFNRRVEIVRSAVIARLEAYERTLVGASALLMSMGDVGREQWKGYVDRLRIAQRYPGIQGLGYAVHLRPDMLAAHERRIRAEGFPEYAVRPVGPRDEYTAIVYLEPFDARNRRAFGYDMFSEPMRHAAMARARDSGEASLSSRVVLLQETDQDVQAGFLMYLPVYRAGLPIESVAQRRAALSGYAYAPFRANDFMRGLLGGRQMDLLFELYAAERPVATKLLYTSQVRKEDMWPSFTKDVPIEFGGERWSLRVWSEPELEAEMRSLTPRAVLVGGGLTTVLVTLLMAAMASLRKSNLRLESRVEERTAEARSSEERLRLMTANIKDYAIIMLAPNGRVMTWNAGAQRLMGYSEDEIVGAPGACFHTSEDVATGKVGQLLEMAESKGISEDEGWRVRKDGTRFYAEAVITAIRDRFDQLLGFAEIIHDITERKAAEAEILSLNTGLEQHVAERTSELQAANRELESFAYAISHDLRAPLRAMIGFSQALQEDFGADLPAEARGFLDQIAIGGRRMGELVDGLLTLSRSTRGELRRDVVDLSAMAERILTEFASTEPQRRVSWAISPGLTARGDSRMLEIVLRNLLENAWKYTERKAEASIRVYEEKIGDGATMYCVSDNGAGFDMAHAGRLFKPFQRLHRQEEFAGTGIGLATVMRIVHRHGGEIRAEGIPGQGAKFCFCLNASASLQPQAT